VVVDGWLVSLLSVRINRCVSRFTILRRFAGVLQGTIRFLESELCMAHEK
jgi:hypothetical protein